MENCKTDTSIRCTIFNVPMDDFYWKLYNVKKLKSFKAEIKKKMVSCIPSSSDQITLMKFKVYSKLGCIEMIVCNGRSQKSFHRLMLLREHWSILRRNWIISTSQGLLLMIVKGTNTGPTVVSFALAGAETNVLASLATGIVPIVHTIYRQRLMILDMF